MNNVVNIAKNAKEASIKALQLSDETKNQALNAIAKSLEKNKFNILEANAIDINNAKKMLTTGEISQSAFNRLKFDDNKFRDMVQGIKNIALLPDPVNQILWSKNIANGITLTKVSCPIGVIGVIFEARPDVISQISSLAIKSSNAVILKGGSEAVETNKTIFNIIIDVLNNIKDFPSGFINLLFSREDVKELLNADEYIDLIIPRGSNSLVKYIKSNTKIPVLGHADGICHIFIDEFADENKAFNICIDAKCQYPSACNSVETILVHENLSNEFLKNLLELLKKNDVTINSCETILQLYPQYINEKVVNWKHEYGDKTVSVKIVKNIDEAINHINKFGSGHTDCIITENTDNAEKFMTFVDSAGVYKNVSTRFADGYRYGFGAEVGISTNKTHARGPVGLDGLTIYKYKLCGNGDIVSDFISGNKTFY